VAVLVFFRHVCWQVWEVEGANYLGGQVFLDLVDLEHPLLLDALLDDKLNFFLRVGQEDRDKGVVGL
jgi:hypothetical protein